MKAYPAVIEKGDDAYYVFFPDVPGATAADESVNGALYWAGEILNDHLQDMLDAGDVLPEPTDISRLQLDVSVKPVSVALVAVRVPTTTRKVTFSINSSLLDDIDRDASNRGMSRSGFLAEAARRYLQENRV